MFKKICITNRHLTDDLKERIKAAIDRGADTVILREKDMAEDEYRTLAEDVINLCEEMGAELILHTFKGAAADLAWRKIHLTMADFEKLTDEERKYFCVKGVSTHTMEEAVLAERLGASYVTASPIYETQCKPGVKPAGIDYLRRTAGAVGIPVYALGGIDEDNMTECVSAGAAGVCMMSGYMKRG